MKAVNIDEFSSVVNISLKGKFNVFSLKTGFTLKKKPFFRKDRKPCKKYLFLSVGPFYFYVSYMNVDLLEWGLYVPS